MSNGPVVDIWFSMNVILTSTLSGPEALPQDRTPALWAESFTIQHVLIYSPYV
jgi:hypothetical protein